MTIEGFPVRIPDYTKDGIDVVTESLVQQHREISEAGGTFIAAHAIDYKQASPSSGSTTIYTHEKHIVLIADMPEAPQTGA